MCVLLLATVNSDSTENKVMHGVGKVGCLSFVQIPSVTECYATAEDIDRREAWGLWTDASHIIRGTAGPTSQKIAFEKNE